MYYGHWMWIPASPAECYLALNLWETPIQPTMSIKSRTPTNHTRTIARPTSQFSPMRPSINCSLGMRCTKMSRGQWECDWSLCTWGYWPMKSGLRLLMVRKCFTHIDFVIRMVLGLSCARAEWNKKCRSSPHSESMRSVPHCWYESPCISSDFQYIIFIPQAPTCTMVHRADPNLQVVITSPTSSPTIKGTPCSSLLLRTVEESLLGISGERSSARRDWTGRWI